jgi:hypothetical protein
MAAGVLILVFGDKVKSCLFAVSVGSATIVAQLSGVVHVLSVQN